jgi:hypothetical protein
LRDRQHAVDTTDVDLALRLVRHCPPPGAQLGFALYLPIPAILELPDATSHDLYPYALAISAVWATNRGELDHIEDSCQKALRAARRLSSRYERGRVEYLVTVAQAGRSSALGRWRESARYYEQTAEIARGNVPGWGRAGQLANAAICYTMAGDPQAGVDIAKKALELARAAGGPIQVVSCLVALAGALADVEPVQTHKLLEEALVLQQGLGIETAILVTQATLVGARMGD